MATQVVNLLHYRSLDLGAVPPNLEFGQFGLNVYNANNPVLPTLREVYLFVGVGGNERVNEDGTDLTAEAFNAGAFAGEALVNGKGWIRFNLRSLSTSGDSMYGDLIISGARIRFEAGATGNAELILPDETVANGSLPGSLRYNASTGVAEIWDGLNWLIVSGPDFQIVTVEPTTRASGTILKDGDLYYNSTFSKLYIYQTGAWTETQDNTDVQLSTLAPVTRSSTEALRAGDLYFDPATKTLYVWDLTEWQKVIGPSGDFQIVTGLTPTKRSDGVSSLQIGDNWWRDDIFQLYIWDGAVWQQVGRVSGDYQESNASPPTVRTTADALQPGDFYVDTSSNTLHFYSSAGVWEKPQPVIEFQSGTSAPTTKTNGNALIPGDQWYDGTQPSLYFWDGTVWVSFASLI